MLLIAYMVTLFVPNSIDHWHIGTYICYITLLCKANYKEKQSLIYYIICMLYHSDIDIIIVMGQKLARRTGNIVFTYEKLPALIKFDSD